MRVIDFLELSVVLGEKDLRVTEGVKYFVERQPPDCTNPLNFVSYILHICRMGAQESSGINQSINHQVMS